MFSTKEIDHENRNQTNYHGKAKDHDTLSLASTLYLAYRDINLSQDRHLYHKLANKNPIARFWMWRRIKYRDYSSSPC